MKSIFLIILLLPLSLKAKFKEQGEITFESRLFEDDNDAATIDKQLSLFTRLDGRYKQNKWILKYRGYARADREDKDRSLFAIEELYVQKKLGDFKLALGHQLFNWSATEAFHPADIINSRNLDGNPENYEKLGELTLSTEVKLFGGILQLLYFPHYQAPEYPSKKSRLGYNIHIDEPIWKDRKLKASNDNWGHQGGIRFNTSNSLGDFSVHALKVMDRHTPYLTLENDGGIHPNYFEHYQIGATTQIVIDRYVIKLELAHKDFNEADIFTIYGNKKTKDYQQAALGSEYNYAFSNGSEIKVLLEFQNYFSLTKSQRREIHPFQRDGLIGFLYNFNDLSAQEISFNTIIDLEQSKQYMFNLKYTKRLSNFWKIDTGIKSVIARPKDNLSPKGLELLNDNDQLYVNLRRFF